MNNSNGSIQSIIYENLRFISQTHRSCHEQRRKIEIRTLIITLTFFALVMAAGFGDKIKFPDKGFELYIIIGIIFLFIIAFASILFLRSLHRANEINKSFRLSS